jgi:hypothetical protein
MNEKPFTAKARRSQSRFNVFFALFASSRFSLIFAILLAAFLSTLGPGNFWLGWLAYAAILVPGRLALTAAWRWAAGGKSLAWMLAIAFLLRLAAGLAFTLLLPAAGYDNPTQNAGYVFFDAFRRDTQAWELAESSAPLMQAFSKSYSTDQYGGLLALSGLLYRYLSPDTHRQMLPVVVGALVFTLGTTFLFKATKSAFGEQTAFLAGWIFALYPESILQGSSQMREPFLMTFATLAFYGAVAWPESHRRAWPWLAASLTGMLLISPGIALVTLVVLAGWFYFGGEKRRISWSVIIVAGLVFIAALILFAWGASRGASSGSPLAAALNWFREAVKWDAYLLDRSSGWVQKLFDEMPAALHLPFVAVYGMLQPVLPAALVEPGLPLWKTVGVLRAFGWYALLPLLGYGLLAAWRKPEASQRRGLLWLGAVSWIWIILTALRAGGDLWDNPRYRVILLAFEAILAAQALTGWSARRDPWLPRLLTVEAVFLLVFGHWYAARYFHWPGQLPFFGMVVLILGLSGLVLGVGFWRDNRPKVRRASGDKTTDKLS